MVPEQTQSVLWESGNERCVRLLPEKFGGSGNAIGSRWRDTLNAGKAITVQSRGEEVVHLDAQTLGNATMYATAERWLAFPLPDDSQLMINGSDQFPAFEPLGLSPLTRLVVNAPEGGVMTRYSDSVQWEPSADDLDGIELLVSSSGASTASLETVKCWLADSGEFVLPPEARTIFSPSRQLAVRLHRAKYSNYESDDATLLVTQTSYP